MTMQPKIYSFFKPHEQIKAPNPPQLHPVNQGCNTNHTHTPSIMDCQNQSVHNEDDELEILEYRAPTPSNNMVGCNSEKPPKKHRPNTSDIWNYFTKPCNGKTSCKGCGKEYTWGGSNYGTSTLRRHRNGCVSTPKCKEVVSSMLDHEGEVRSSKIEPKKVREIISMAIVSHDLPLSFVEYKWIRALLNYLNPNDQNISRLTTTNDILKVYCAEKEKLKRVMIDSPGRICLTSDCTSQGYICVTAHFVDSEWKLNSKILSFCEMEPSHSGWELAIKVYDCLKEWGIDKKIFSLTLDNAYANDSWQDMLKEKLSLQESLLSNGKFFHVRCCAHILNVIVQEGLRVANEALKKIRESIKYVKATEGRMENFLECVSQVGGIETKMGLRLDLSTTWNSTYTMLENAIKYRHAFSSLQMVDRNYTFAPTNKEWTKGEKMCEFLRPFFVMTNLISGSSYPTSNLYFMQVWKIECFLKANVESEDEDIRDMAMQMKVKFDKYWSDYSIVLAFGAVLDPRAKLGMIKYCYSQLDQDTCQEKIDHIRSNLQMLFGEYVKWMASTEPTGSCSQDSSGSSSLATPSRGGKGKEHASDFGLYDVIQDWQSKSSESQNEKSELDQYLDEPPLELKYFPNLEVLEFWKNNKNRYPTLSVMACDILSIPITTMASESDFSIGARVLNKYRSRLIGDHVQALICTRSWLQGFVDDEDDSEEDTLSKAGSNVVEDIVV